MEGWKKKVFTEQGSGEVNTPLATDTEVNNCFSIY